jgi:hypothetical protein
MSRRQTWSTAFPKNVVVEDVLGMKEFMRDDVIAMNLLCGEDAKPLPEAAILLVLVKVLNSFHSFCKRQNF